MGIEEYLDIGMSYVRLGINFVRDLIGKVIGWTGFDSRLGTMILMLAVSILLARLIAKRYVTKPFSGMYFIPTIIITLLIFILLMYL